MRISRIRVNGLFGHFNHELGFEAEERIRIILGPNGFGKTTILRIVNGLFNQPVRRLGGMPDSYRAA